MRSPNLRFLRKGDKARAAALWQARFGDPAAFTDWYFGNRFLPEHSLGLFDNDTLISMAFGTPVRLWMRRCVLPAMLVSGVATREGFERRGYMRRVMEAMLRHAREAGCAAVMLKPAVQGVYDSLGFACCSDSREYRFNSEFGIRNSEFILTEATPATLLGCYEHIMSGYSASLVRDEAAFGLKLAENACDGGQLLAVADKQGRIMGYALYHAEGDGCRLTEVVGEDTAIMAILGQLSARYAGEIVAKLPPDSALPGTNQPQNALTIVNVPMALGAVLGDASLNFKITGAAIAEDNGAFDGTGKRLCGAGQYQLGIGEFSQALCGYTALADLLPAIPCFCADEF